ncbi:ABA4-like family protein, partial [Micromonospora sp. 4G55]|uniref:ABA4-like family protein n=1 Tax=Micromonospora sp. 4G55 TaxID=2806102 RepID=UPI001EE43B72
PALVRDRPDHFLPADRAAGPGELRAAGAPGARRRAAGRDGADPAGGARPARQHDGAAAAWAHMVGFDLFVGRWAWLDGRDRGVPALVMAPVLVLTILLGPLGLAAYLAVRARWARPAVVPAREPQRLG